MLAFILVQARPRLHRAVVALEARAEQVGRARAAIEPGKVNSSAAFVGHANRRIPHLFAVVVAPLEPEHLPRGAAHVHGPRPGPPGASPPLAFVRVNPFLVLDQPRLGRRSVGFFRRYAEHHSPRQTSGLRRLHLLSEGEAAPVPLSGGHGSPRCLKHQRRCLAVRLPLLHVLEPLCLLLRIPEVFAHGFIVKRFRSELRPPSHRAPHRCRPSSSCCRCRCCCLKAKLLLLLSVA
mmetsp:Transcript_8187/g.15671  ORF Transcript_8187/g.15671 Transcript_8187/m.15671 type:complete len:235 (+) Transcript_8187:195-899(+)